MNFRWKSKAPNLRQPKLSACYKESVEAIFRSVNVTFLTWKCLGIVDTPSLYKGRSKGRGVSFQNFQKKGGGGSDFSDKNGGVGKIGVIVLKKGSITYFYTYYPFPVLSFPECLVCVCVCVHVCVCVCFVYLHIYTISISVLFVFHRKNLIL